MINSIELIAKHLNEYPVKYIINAPETAHFEKCTVFSSTLNNFTVEELYILDEADITPDIFRMDKMNFFIIGSESAHYQSQISQTSNIIIVSSEGNPDKTRIYNSVNCCCSAIRQFHGYAPRLLGASLLTASALTELLRIFSASLSAGGYVIRFHNSSSRPQFCKPTGFGS